MTTKDKRDSNRHEKVGVNLKGGKFKNEQCRGINYNVHKINENISALYRSGLQQAAMKKSRTNSVSEPTIIM